MEMKNKRAINISISDNVRRRATEVEDSDVGTPRFNLSWSDNYSDEELQAPNPQCEELVCMESFWDPERGLCLYCGYRKKN